MGRPFQRTELGHLPKRWDIKSLGEVADVIDPHPSHRAPKIKEGGFPFAGIGDIYEDGNINVEKCRKIGEKFVRKQEESYELNNHSIGYGRVGTVGKVVKLKKQNYRYAISPTLAIINYKENIFPEFLFAVVNSNLFFKQIYQMMTGATRPSIGIMELRKIKVPFPGIEEQKKIGFLISNYQSLIENNEKRIKIIENIAKLIYEEWFVRFQFPGHEKVKIVDSETEFGNIPEGWDVKSIMDYKEFDFINTNIKEFDGEKEYFATANISGLDIIKEGEFVNYKNKPSRAQKEPVLNSVWFARMKDTYKVLGVTKINEGIAKNSILSSGFAGFRCEKNIFPFLFVNINSKRFEVLKNLYATGATQVSINNDGIRNIKIISPKREIVESFGELINPLLNQLFLFQQKNQNLRKTRDLLLPKLISGEIDVTELDIQLNQEVVNT